VEISPNVQGRERLISQLDHNLLVAGLG